MEESNEKMFPLEKILTVSARDYVESVRKRLSDYVLRGVHYQCHMGDLAGIVSEVPNEAEVVTDLVVEYHPGFSIYVSGTALIPRKK